MAKFTGPLILDEKDKAERDKYTRIYEAAKEAKKERLRAVSRSET